MNATIHDPFVGQPIKIVDCPTIRVKAKGFKPGDIIWLSRKCRGMLGTKDRVLTVKTVPVGSPGYDSLTYDAWEFVEGQSYPNLISVCCGAEADYEVVVLPRMR